MAGTNYKPPKLYDITVADLFVLIAHENPRRDIVQIIQEHLDAPTDSIRVTWGTLIQHIQNAAADLRARWAQRLKDDVAKSQAGQPRVPGAPPVVVGMLGANGYEYYVNMLACTINRWTVLLISLKNSPAAIEHLLRTSNSSLFIADSNGLDHGRTLEQCVPGLITLPFASLGDPGNHPISPLIPATPEQVKTEMDLPAFYMHTSGSTGHPKIITWSHRFFLGGARARQRDGPEAIGLPFYSVPPLFHAMGLFAFGMFVPAHANLITFVSSPTPKPPSAASLLAHIPFIKDGIIALPPSILEELYELGPEAVKTVADGTSMVIFAGAPLKKSTGDALIATGLKLTAAYGSTEISPGTKMYRQRPENWEYVEFRDGYDWQFLPVDDHSELRELVVASSEDCPAVINHENPRGFATNDIWVPHPSIPNLWKHYSRKGDVTVLSNGEKTDNKQIEGLLLRDKRILYVQVFGAGRPLNGVILQPANPFQSTFEFLAEIQPTIEDANLLLPRHSRLVPELIIIASQDKPFATTDKGTVKTKETLDKYAEEIQNGYAVLEGGEDGNDWVFDGSIANIQDILYFLRIAVRGVLGKDVPDAADLFEYGFDSLLAIRLRGALLSAIRKTPIASQSVPRNIIYTFPTINALAYFLLYSASSDKPHPGNTSHERILRSISKFSSTFSMHIPGTKRVQGLVVALTGSTGSLGTSLLALLLEKDDVSKIYLLNRKGAGTQKDRQTARLRERGLDPTVLEEKNGIIVYLDVDLSRRDLGLPRKEYDDLQDNVTHIIHAAWHLNFNLILESYERVHIAGVQHLIDLALSSPQSETPRLVFLSSIAAAERYRGPSQAVAEGEQAGQILIPEEPIDDPSIPLDTGYGQSKYVSERLLVNAVHRGLRTTIVRVGQLSGVTTNGAWSLSEHVPIMLRSSMALGIIPNDLPPVRWVPSDVAASALVKQIFGSSAALEYFHVENTVPTSWVEIAHLVSEFSPHPLRLVTFAAWLEHIAGHDVDPERVPAMRLLDFFRGVAQNYSTTALGWQRSVQVAPELAVGVITEFIKRYVAYQLERSGNE